MTKRLLLFIILLVTMCLLCSCENWKIHDSHNTAENHGRYGNIYEISEFLDAKQYERYMKDDRSRYDKLQNAKYQLDNAQEFELYSYANNFIEIIDVNVPDECIVNHGTEYESDSKYEIDGEKIIATEAIQVSENFFALFPMQVSSGRCFESIDFQESGEGVIPVILGNAYRDTFDLGDTFKGYYICERRTFEVIGFAKQGSAFYSKGNNTLTDYEQYIIMPFENVAHDSYSARAVLLQQICGFVEPKGSRDAALSAVRKILTDAGLEDWIGMVRINEKSVQDKLDGIIK